MKTYIVSGTARSGTSLMMSILINALGEHRLIGYKFPQFEKYLEKLENETDEEYKIRIFNEEIANPLFQEKKNKSYEMNPMGFWEDPSCVVSGLYYNPNKLNIINKINSSKTPLILKLDGRGLPKSNPQYIDKVIFMLRNPHEVAKSQENLIRDSKYIMEDGSEIDLFENLKPNTPEMFINTNINCAKWFLENPDVNHITILYDDLLENPKETINKIHNFLSDGDFTESYKLIKKKLRRSIDFSTEYDDYDLWKEAELVYQFMQYEDYEELIKYSNNKNLEFVKRNKNWICSRYGQRVFYKTCEQCINNKKFRNKLKEHAERIKNDWTNKPCSYECAYKLDGKLISIEESIKTNFWK